MSEPWWVARVRQLLDPRELGALELGALWRLLERLEFVRLNVEPELLALDLAAAPESAKLWAELAPRSSDVKEALAIATLALATRLKDRSLSAAMFRAHWEALGFVRHFDGGGTPADDFLDAMFHLSRLEAGDERASHATLNLPSRAERVSDFLTALQPGASDTVFDLGSGGGKLALTVAASSDCAVHGVELVPSFVADSRALATTFGMTRARFSEADVRDVDLSAGTMFYLYYPFHGAVARTVADSLAALSRRTPISLYVAGPQLSFGEYFTAHVASGAFTLVERRGEFGEAMVLESPR